MKKNYNVHFYYIISILLLIIIVLITKHWGQIPNLVILISFAATLSSLVLAILAIVYAFYSNNSFQQNTKNLNEASKNISETSQELLKMSLDLTNKIEQIPSSIDSLAIIQKQTNEKLQNINELISQPQPNKQPKLEQLYNKPINIDESIINESFTLTSINGIIILYCLTKSFQNQKSLNPEYISTIANMAFTYFQGYTIALISLRLLFIDTKDNKDWKIIKVDQNILKYAEIVFNGLEEIYLKKPEANYINESIRNIKLLYS